MARDEGGVPIDDALCVRARGSAPRKRRVVHSFITWR
jgi:hypothetical protein